MGNEETGFLDNKLLLSVNCDGNTVIALASTVHPSPVAQLVEHGASLISTYRLINVYSGCTWAKAYAKHINVNVHLKSLNPLQLNDCKCRPLELV